MQLLYFAWVRERIGRDDEAFDFPEGVTLSVDALLDQLAARGGGYAAALADRSAIRVAVNQDYVTGDHLLGPRDEVAIFPPVTGGVEMGGDHD